MRVDSTDLTKSLMTEGDWHIVPAEHVNDWVGFDRESVIVHECPEWEAPKDNFGRPYTPKAWEPLTYWTRPESLKVPCNICGMHPPEAIASLWLLHNFDTFAGENVVTRAFNENVLKSEYEIEKAFHTRRRSMSDRLPTVNDGREMFRDGDWVLFHDYLPRGSGWGVGIGHHCHGENWRTRIGLNPSVSEQCSNCGTTVPKKLIGLQKLAEWDR